MIDIQLEPARLVAHSSAQGHNDARDEDLGYAVHGWLRATFGDSAPRLFRIVSGRMEAVRILAYSSLDSRELHARAHECASPLAYEVCHWESAASKSLEDINWRVGRTLGFEVRIAPIVRGGGRERDAYLAELDDRPGEDVPGRESVYSRWLGDRLDRFVDASSDRMRLSSFRLTTTWRQAQSIKGTRYGRRITLPDAIMEGALTIREKKAFEELLFGGIGRHRAFGFGMLLVRPL